MSKTYLEWSCTREGRYRASTIPYEYLIRPSVGDPGWILWLPTPDGKGEKQTFELLKDAKARADAHYIEWLNVTRSDRLTGSRTPTAHASRSATHIMQGKDVDPTGEARS